MWLWLCSTIQKINHWNSWKLGVPSKQLVVGFVHTWSYMYQYVQISRYECVCMCKCNPKSTHTHTPPIDWIVKCRPEEPWVTVSHCDTYWWWSTLGVQHVGVFRILPYHKQSEGVRTCPNIADRTCRYTVHKPCTFSDSLSICGKKKALQSRQNQKTQGKSRPRLFQKLLECSSARSQSTYNILQLYSFPMFPLQVSLCFTSATYHSHGCHLAPSCQKCRAHVPGNELGEALGRSSHGFPTNQELIEIYIYTYIYIYT